MAAQKKLTDPVLQRAAKAWERRGQWNAVLSDTYRYCLPGGDPDNTRVEGQKTDVETYDSTGVRALRKRQSRMHGQLYPPFQQVWEFEFDGMPLDNITDEDAREQARAILARNAEKVFWAVTNSNFHLEMVQAERDALVSTGCIAVNKGDPDRRPLVFEALPIGQYAPEESPITGALEDVFRKRKPKRRDVEVLWPAADFSGVTDWEKKLKDDPDGEVEVTEAQIFDAKAATWKYLVYLNEGEHKVFEHTFNSKRIIPFRLEKFTGETLGRGPAMACRADMATANKVKELVLKNASIDVVGIWQADDDGVLNPANIKLVPGTIIPKAVGSNGLQPVRMPGRMDVSQIVLADLEKTITETIEGPPLPGFDQDRPVAYAFLSAERDRAAVEVPEHLRMFFELDYYLVRAIVDILSSPSFDGSPYKLETFTVSGAELKPVPSNPLIALQRQAEAKARAQALSEVSMVAPEETKAEVKIGAWVRDHLIEAGFPDSLLYSPEEKQLEAKRQQALQQAFAAGVQQGVAMSAKMAKTDAGTELLGQAGAEMGGTDAAA
ncbi:MAG: hypothetical protein H7Y60_11795 [Rhodospirillaceae bacterium]|nr:hypothetical protein [Rhodospirillales bacterium]